MQQAPALLQTCPEGQPPHCRTPPQPSLTGPHWPLWQVEGVQQLPPKHTSLPEQAGHWSVPPQRSETAPHWPGQHAVSGAQHWPPGMQMLVDAQPPHCTVPPQPSLHAPQDLPSDWHVAGTQVTHAPFEHFSPRAHGPQSRYPPQPSLMGPHSLWASAQVRGRHVTHLPFSHCLPAGQDPHETTWQQPRSSVPHS